MIRISECRVGNLIIESLPFGSDKVITVDICSLNRHPDDFIPVPLTEKWLVNQFGFKEVKPREGVARAFKLKSIRIEMSNSGNFYFKNKPVRAVHTVQNLYFTNEQEELNLKSNKP